jgi:pyruvate-ferredoxin/flavodoxin oxidoreductase
MSLPAVGAAIIDSLVDPGDVETEVYRLLDKHAYHSLVGGDAAPPGQSVKTAVHLVTGAVESVMRRRYEAHLEKLSSLIRQLEDKIQGKVTESVEINDFDTFGRELDRLDKQRLTPEKLAKLAGTDAGNRDVDPQHLKRLGDTLAALKRQRKSYSGSRARMILTIDPGGTAFWSGTYPDNPHTQPWVCNLPGDAPALAEGVFEGVTRALAEELAVCRRAELELEDSYEPREHDSYFRRFDWREFSSEERDLVPPILVLGYTGFTAWDDIFRLLARRFPVKILVVNTGAIPVDFTIARDSDESSPTVDRPTESSKNNDPGLLALARRGVYVLQSTVGHPGHLIRGVVRGLSRPYPALFHVHAPDPQTSGVAPEKVAEQAELAFQSRAFPLFEADPDTPGALVNLECNPDPGERWTSRELTFADGPGREEKEVLPVTVADWAVGQSRFQQHFTVYSKGHLNDRMKLIPDYLALARDQRAAYDPIIHVVDEEKRRAVAVLSPAMVQAEEERQLYWKYLRELAAGVGASGEAAAEEQPAEAPAKEPAAAPEAAPPSGPDLDQALHQKLTEKLLWLSGFSQDPDFFKQSLREFLIRKRESGTEANTPAE